MKGGRNNLALENGKARGSVPSNQGNVNIGLVQRNKKPKIGMRVDKTTTGGKRRSKVY